MTDNIPASTITPLHEQWPKGPPRNAYIQSMLEKATAFHAKKLAELERMVERSYDDNANAPDRWQGVDTEHGSLRDYVEQLASYYEGLGQQIEELYSDQPDHPVLGRRRESAMSGGAAWQINIA